MNEFDMIIQNWGAMGIVAFVVFWLLTRIQKTLLSLKIGQIKLTNSILRLCDRIDTLITKMQDNER